MHYKHYHEFFKEKKEPVFVRRVCEKNYIHPVLHLAVKSSFRTGLLHRTKFVQTDAHKSSSQVRQEDFEACQIVRIVCLFLSFIGGYCINSLYDKCSYFLEIYDLKKTYIFYPRKKISFLWFYYFLNWKFLLCD